MAWIIEYSLPDSGNQVIRMEAGKSVKIGRGNDSDTKIPDPALSRLHCELSVEDSQLWLADLGSSVGTYVGSQKVEREQLKPGQSFRAGNTEFRVSSEATMEAMTRFGADFEVDHSPLLEELQSAGKLDRYELKKLANDGGRNLVFHAVDSESGKEVAVKVIPTEMDDEGEARFIRAMKMLQDLRDPHLVKMYRAGKKDRYCWISMEWFETGSIADRAERQGINNCLDWKDVWRVAASISKSLATLEREGIVHRSIRPTNILFRTKDSAWVLSDLVVAKAEDSSNAKMVTRHTFLPSDLAYTAPERLLGRESNDHSLVSDIYSLGAILTELLTGSPPFGRGDLMDLLPKLSKPRTVITRESQLGMNEMIGDLVNKMTEPEPENRFNSAADLIAEVDRVGKLTGMQS